MSLVSSTFTVSLKLANQNIKLLISVQDSTDDVFQRLRSAYPTCNNKKSQILEKLIASLKFQLSNQTLNHNLLNSISQFLERNNLNNNGQTNEKNDRNSNETAEKMDNKSKVLQNLSTNKQNQKNPFKKRLSCVSQKQQNPNIPMKKCSVPAKPKLSTPNKTNKTNQTGSSVDRPKKCNPDVVKACELILKKTHNTQMKQMAKEFLKEKGYLKEERQKAMSQNKKTYPDSLKSNEKIQQNPPFTETVPNKDHNQSIENPKCETSAILTNITTVNVCRNRFGKYKYLQSSLLNESLSKDYHQLSKQESSILKESEARPKKYSYLE